MEKPHTQELFDYYDERAPEYEDFYYGKFPKKIIDPAIYQNDIKKIQELLPNYISGKCIDIACGTGFWLPVYAKKCTYITLIDQSESMLAECVKKIQALGIEKRTKVIQADIFNYPLPKHEYDSSVIGFLFSHLRETELDNFLNILKTLLKPNGRYATIDSVWSKEIIAMGRTRVGMSKRILKDGCEFKIYKRYFEKPELQNLARKFNLGLKVIYWGKVFFLVVGNYHK